MLGTSVPSHPLYSRRPALCFKRRKDHDVAVTCTKAPKRKYTVGVASTWFQHAIVFESSARVLGAHSKASEYLENFGDCERRHQRLVASTRDAATSKKEAGDKLVK